MCIAIINVGIREEQVNNSESVLSYTNTTHLVLMHVKAFY